MGFTFVNKNTGKTQTTSNESFANAMAEPGSIRTTGGSTINPVAGDYPTEAGQPTQTTTGTSRIITSGGAGTGAGAVGTGGQTLTQPFWETTTPRAQPQQLPPLPPPQQLPQPLQRATAPRTLLSKDTQFQTAYDPGANMVTVTDVGTGLSGTFKPGEIPGTEFDRGERRHYVVDANRLRAALGALKTVRDERDDVTWDPETRKVGMAGELFEHGEIPGTVYHDGRHYVYDPEALAKAVAPPGEEVTVGDEEPGEEAPPEEAPPEEAPLPDPGISAFVEDRLQAIEDMLLQQQYQAQDMIEPQEIATQISPQVQEALDYMSGYIGTPPQTIEELLSGDYAQTLLGSTEKLRDKQLREARAELASTGALGGPDTRAADRYAQVASEIAGIQAGEILPQVLEQSRAQRAAGLDELITNLGMLNEAERDAFDRAYRTYTATEQARQQEHSQQLQAFQAISSNILGAGQLGVNEFQATMPYHAMTEAERQAMQLRWVTEMGYIPGGSGQMVPAREYVEQRGGNIDWRQTDDGETIVTINNKDVPVRLFNGYIKDGRVHLPQVVVDQVLAGRPAEDWLEDAMAGSGFDF